MLLLSISSLSTLACEAPSFIETAFTNEITKVAHYVYQDGGVGGGKKAAVCPSCLKNSPANGEYGAKPSVSPLLKNEVHVGTAFTM